MFVVLWRNQIKSLLGMTSFLLSTTPTLLINTLPMHVARDCNTMELKSLVSNKARNTVQPLDRLLIALNRGNDKSKVLKGLAGLC